MPSEGTSLVFARLSWVEALGHGPRTDVWPAMQNGDHDDGWLSAAPAPEPAEINALSAVATPPIAPPPDNTAPTPTAPAAGVGETPPAHRGALISYEPAPYAGYDGIDPKVHRLVRDQIRRQDELKAIMGELAPKLDVVEEKLLGGKKKDRRSRVGISPLEMLACLQTVVDEHRMMESESIQKDETLDKLRNDLTQALERQSQLVEEKHEFLKQQNQLLMGQSADQKTLVELQYTRETHTRDISELNSQLAAALSKAQGMSTVEVEMSRLRMEHGAAVASLGDQLMVKEADVAEVAALIAEAKQGSTAANIRLESMTQQAADLEAQIDTEGQATIAAAAADGDAEAEASGQAGERTALQAQLDTSREAYAVLASSIDEKTAETTTVQSAVEAGKSRFEDAVKQREEMRSATAQQEAESEAQAREKVKQILQKVYASLGEEFVDGENFDGAVVRGAIKRAILQAMKS